MSSLPSKKHIVRVGDNLASIAKLYGFRDWETIYWHPLNARFRKGRPDPGVIRPNDVVEIPPSPEQARQYLQKKIETYRAIRRETEKLHQDCGRELDSGLAAVNRAGQTVDTAATAATMLFSLGQLVKKAGQAVSKTGEELAKINRELAKDALHFAYDPIRDAGLQAGADAVNPDTGANTVLLLGKVAVGAFFDLQSPSFWAHTYVQLRDGRSWSQAVARRPEDTAREVKEKLTRAHQTTLAAIDAKIRDAETALQQLPVQEKRIYYGPIH